MAPSETRQPTHGWRDTSWVFVGVGVLVLALNAMRVGPSSSKMIVSFGALPAAVTAAIDSAYQGAVFLEASSDGPKGRRFYNVEITHQHHRVEARFDPRGRVLEEEREIPMHEVPASVRATFANSAQASWTILSVERVRQPAPKPSVCYELTVGQGTVRLELVYGEDGRRMSARRLTEPD